MVSAVARPGMHKKADEEDDEKLVYKDRVFATQNYIPWIVGSLKLGDKCDFTRVRRDQVRVLVGHNGQLPVGRVTRARHDRDGQCFRSDFEIPKLESTADIREKMDAGLMRDISVGAKLNWDSITLDNADDEWESIDDALWTAHQWEYVEQSLTPIPADGRAGMDRADSFDLLRDDGDIVVFEEGRAIILERTVEAQKPRFVQLAEQKHLQRREGTMTTAIDAASQLEAARREAQAKRDAEASENQLIKSIAGLQVDRDEQAKVISRLETELAKANESLEGRDADILELRGMRDIVKQLEGKLETSEADRKTEAEKREDLEKKQMELAHKLDTIQFQPGGQVLQMTNWKVGERKLSMGNIVKLTWQSGLSPDGPSIDHSRTTLEESFLEQHKSERDAQTQRHPISSNAVAMIPWAALAERERQDILERNTVAGGAGVRPLEYTVLGDAGLVLARYAPILSRMDVRMGVVGDQRLGSLSAQGIAAGQAEAADITVRTWNFGGTAHQPVTISTAFQMSSALRSIDDGTFERIVRQSIFMVLNNEVTSQVLVGGGTNEIDGIWGQTNLPNTDYGAAQTDFGRDDILAALNAVRLADTDGAAPIVVASNGMWQLMERTPRSVVGTSGQGYTEVTRFILDDIRWDGNSGHMGMVEGAECFHYSDIAPASVNDPAIIMKPDRAVVWFWGDSLFLEYVPTIAAAYTYKMTAESNADFELALSNSNANGNFSRIKRS